MSVFVVWFSSDFWMLAVHAGNLNPASRTCVMVGESLAKILAKANRSAFCTECVMSLCAIKLDWLCVLMCVLLQHVMLMLRLVRLV